MIQFDETDRALIALLSENARASATELSKRLGLARTTVQARIEKLEQSGAIAGYTIRRGQRLDPAIRATVLIGVEPRATASVLARLKQVKEVETVHTTSGRFDLVAELAAQTTEALDRALDQIGEAKGVRGSESLIHLSTRIDRRGG
ncbi:Lrp/AsnC family transcriptional regulator [Ponticoccus gilvus]|nr:Lrp/AsnC family transcriptional regulator [Enemella evansiae]